MKKTKKDEVAVLTENIRKTLQKSCKGFIGKRVTPAGRRMMVKAMKEALNNIFPPTIILDVVLTPAMEENLMLTNFNKPPIKVKHGDLKRVGDSRYKSECPKCEDGILLVARNPKTLQLEAGDHCMLCGQAFIYTDITKMRRGEKA